MPCFRGYLHAVTALLAGLLAVGTLPSCSPSGSAKEQARVAEAFNSWKNAMINCQTDQAMVYIPRHVDDYLSTLNSGVATPAPATTVSPVASPSPGVDLLLRTALVKKVPADLRANLTLGVLLQRISDRHLFNPRDVREIDLGHVFVNGNRADAELYYQGTLTALRLPFVKEGHVWKIDVMAILPYAEVLMRVDRAIKGETEAQQVDQLVSKLPSL
jgi:hypothetical protein